MLIELLTLLFLNAFLLCKSFRQAWKNAAQYCRCWSWRGNAVWTELVLAHVRHVATIFRTWHDCNVWISPSLGALTFQLLWLCYIECCIFRQWQLCSWQWSSISSNNTLLYLHGHQKGQDELFPYCIARLLRGCMSVHDLTLLWIHTGQFHRFHCCCIKYSCLLVRVSVLGRLQETSRCGDSGWVRMGVFQLCLGETVSRQLLCAAVYSSYQRSVVRGFVLSLEVWQKLDPCIYRTRRNLLLFTTPLCLEHALLLLSHPQAFISLWCL